MDAHAVTLQQLDTHQQSVEQQHHLPPSTKDPITSLPSVDDDLWKDMASVSSHSTSATFSSTNSHYSQQSAPPPVPLDEELPPSKRELIKGHLRSIFIAFFRFANKGNNWALIINLLHHLWGARKLVTSKSNQKYYIKQFREVQPIARDVVRGSVGAMHLTFATLTGLALKHRRMSTDRSTLLVLTLAAIGQAWAYARTYWKSGTNYTVRALRQSGILDGIIFTISSIAFSKAVRRSGRLL